jgi:hypothetical protein
MKRKPKPSAPRRRQRPVTAAQARQIAARFDAARRFGGATVKDGGAGLYLSGAARHRDVWLVFPNPVPASAAIRPSEVIAVSKRTGRVIYSGVLPDEG